MSDCLNIMMITDELTDTSSDCEVGFNPSPVSILAVVDGTFTDYQGRRLIGYSLFLYLALFLWSLMLCYNYVFVYCLQRNRSNSRCVILWQLHRLH